jgi:hypothetical protein
MRIPHSYLKIPRSCNRCCCRTWAFKQVWCSFIRCYSKTKIRFIW